MYVIKTSNGHLHQLLQLASKDFDKLPKLRGIPVYYHPATYKDAAIKVWPEPIEGIIVCRLVDAEVVK